MAVTPKRGFPLPDVPHAGGGDFNAHLAMNDGTLVEARYRKFGSRCKGGVCSDKAVLTPIS